MEMIDVGNGHDGYVENVSHIPIPNYNFRSGTHNTAERDLDTEMVDIDTHQQEEEGVVPALAPILSSLLNFTTDENVRRDLLRRYVLSMHQLKKSLDGSLNRIQQRQHRQVAENLWRDIGRAQNHPPVQYSRELLRKKREYRFDSVKEEMMAVFAQVPLQEPMIIDDRTISGRTLEKTEAVLVMALMNPRSDPNGELEDFIRKMVGAGPWAEPPPSNLKWQAEYAEIHASTEPGRMLPDMTRLLNQFQADEHNQKWVLKEFSLLACHLIDLWKGYRYDPPDDLIQVAIFDLAQNYFDHRLGNPFSEVPLGIRRAMSTINIIGTLEYLDYIARTLVNNKHRRSAGYRLQKWLFKAAYENTRSVAEEYQLLSVIREHIRYGYWLLQRRSVRNDYRPDGIPPCPFRPALPPEDYADNEPEFDGFDDFDAFDAFFPGELELFDVEFEPTGQPLSVDDYTTLTQEFGEDRCLICLEDFKAADMQISNPQRPLQIKGCGHVFHGECLETLINGVQKHCDKCPKCREAFCPEREKKVVR